ncbi:MAG TPA: cyclic nucleotide-binding domain-containing protein, partial [Candidatus Methylomirabilis sp.]|nr:cyclic nucleotide-binding domain-containing protein [Candidatus Methylomirabilis sp.]
MFADLPDADLMELCKSVGEVELQPGDILFIEGNSGSQAYVIESGQVEIYKISDGREVQLSVRQPGEVIGEMALLEEAPRMASGRAMTPCRLVEIDRKDMDHLINTNPSAARVMLHTVSTRLRTSNMMLNQSEKLAQLGTMSAGIAHELNNPASAARRGAEQLRGVLEKLQKDQFRLGGMGLDGTAMEALVALEARANQAGTHPAEMNALERSDLQAELEDWMDERNIDDAWEIAPALVPLGFGISDLDQIASQFPEESLEVVLDWVGQTGMAYSLLAEIGEGASRISEIVKALKSYVYLDQAPIQNVDIHDGLENTLVMLRHKLKEGVEVHREYDRSIPHIQAYGSELNQVWTNLIDNAVDAM